MSSWDTNPWSNFCDPHWELICHNKWHLRTSEILIGSWTSDKPFAVSKDFHGDWRGALTLSPFLARSCVSTDVNFSYIACWSLSEWSTCLIKFLCVIPANLAVLKLNLRHLKENIKFTLIGQVFNFFEFLYLWVQNKWNEPTWSWSCSLATLSVIFSCFLLVWKLQQ